MWSCEKKINSTIWPKEYLKIQYKHMSCQKIQQNLFISKIFSLLVSKNIFEYSMQIFGVLREENDWSEDEQKKKKLYSQYLGLDCWFSQQDYY